MTISLRNLPLEIEQAIVEKSTHDGISLNKAATQLLAQALRPSGANADFQEFFGSWSTEAASEFDQALTSLRTIDPEDWASQPEGK